MIPFNRPFIVGKELYYIAKAVEAGHLSGDGPFARRCESWLEGRYGARRVLLTHSCTAALEISALLCDAGPGTDVVMPSFTFTSTANAFALRGARIRFAEIRADTLNIDENRLAEAITPATRVIVPVHYAGVGCAMDEILAIARSRDLTVVEDAAQGVNAAIGGRWLGTIGELGAFSFHETKNFISGEGGALVINDERFVERAEIIRQKGTDRARFERGEVDKYTWVDIGSSYLPSELVAAFLLAQLEEVEKITAHRHTVFNRYIEGLKGLQAAGVAQIPTIPPGCDHNAHLFRIMVESQDVRDRFLSFFRARGILAIFHYIPLHLSPMGRRLGYQQGDFPVTESAAGRLVRLPLYYELEADDQLKIIDAAYDFFGLSAGSA